MVKQKKTNPLVPFQWQSSQIREHTWNFMKNIPNDGFGREIYPPFAELCNRIYSRGCERFLPLIDHRKYRHGTNDSTKIIVTRLERYRSNRSQLHRCVSSRISVHTPNRVFAMCFSCDIISIDYDNRYLFVWVSCKQVSISNVIWQNATTKAARKRIFVPLDHWVNTRMPCAWQAARKWKVKTQIKHITPIDFISLIFLISHCTHTVTLTHSEKPLFNMTCSNVRHKTIGCTLDNILQVKKTAAAAYEAAFPRLYLFIPS